MDFVSNIISNSVSGFVEAGTRSLGNYAGDVLIKAGDMIENTGRGVGTSVERAAGSYAIKISGTPTHKALPAPAPQKMITYGTAAQRADATKMPGKKPASTEMKKERLTGSVASISTPRQGTALAGGGKRVAPSQIVKKVSSSTNKTTSVKRAPASTAKKELPKAYPNNIPYPSAKAKTTSSLPKLYPQTNAGNSSNTSQPQSQQKKVPVRPGGQPRPFVNPDAQTTQNKNNNPTKPLYQGQGNKVAVKPGQPRPLANPDQKTFGESKTAPDGKKVAVKKRYERYKPPVEKGAAVHIPEIKI